MTGLYKEKNEIQISLKIITEELEKLFDYFNKVFYESKLQRPVITIQSGGGKRLTSGWFSGNRWTDSNMEHKFNEINISSEVLSWKTKKQIPEIVCTLLHEMVHLYNYQNKIKDTADNGAHHRKNFGKLAEKKGLLVTYPNKFPNVETEDLNDEGIKVYKESNFNESVLDKFRLDPKFLLIQGLKNTLDSKPDTEEKEDSKNENGQEEIEVKKPKLKSLFCPNCEYKVTVAFGFNKRLRCEGTEDEPCNALLLETVK